MSVPGPPNLGTLPYGNGPIRPKSSVETLEFWWSPPLTGDPATSYILSASNDPNSPYILDSNAYYTRVSTLTNGTPYTYTITASNSQGLGDPATYRTVQPGHKPYIPRNLLASVFNATSVIVSWQPPSTFTDASILGYYIQSQSSDPLDPIVKRSAYPYDTSRLIPGLNTNSLYSFLVRTVNDPGYSPASVSTNTVFLKQPPTANLLIWLDMASSSYYTTSNISGTNYVNQMFDKSGNSYTMDTIPPNSTYGGQSVFPVQGSTINSCTTAYFSGPAGIKLSNTSTLLNGVKNFFWVGRQGEQDINDPTIFFLGDNEASDPLIYYDWHGGYNQGGFGPQNAGFIIDKNLAQPGITSSIATLYVQGSNPIIDPTISTISTFRDFRCLSTGTIFLLSLEGITGNTRFRGLCYDRAFHEGWVGDFGELICYNSALASDQKATVIEYLLNKWGF